MFGANDEIVLSRRMNRDIAEWPPYYSAAKRSKKTATLVVVVFHTDRLVAWLDDEKLDAKAPGPRIWYPRSSGAQSTDEPVHGEG